jgi:hypothetical protein
LPPQGQASAPSAVISASHWPESLKTPIFQGVPRFDVQIPPQNRALQ